MIAACGGQAEQNLTFMLMTSYGQFGFNSSGLIPAADMALEDINKNSQVLPGYRLVYDTLRDSQVSQSLSLNVEESTVVALEIFNIKKPRNGLIIAFNTKYTASSISLAHQTLT